MPECLNECDIFGNQLKRNMTKGVTAIGDLLPRHIPSLQRYGISLTRNRDSANDLVQSCLVHAIAKQNRWRPGTNLGAWLSAIMHNIFVTELRRSAREQQRLPMTDIHRRSSDPEFCCWFGEVPDALEQLPADRRELLLSVTSRELRTKMEQKVWVFRLERFVPGLRGPGNNCAA